jgi:hypothetical protein
MPLKFPIETDLTLTERVAPLGPTPFHIIRERRGDIQRGSYAWQRNPLGERLHGGHTRSKPLLTLLSVFSHACPEPV